MWGAAYRGIGGKAKLAMRLATQPGNWPFLVGFTTAYITLSTVTHYVNDENKSESMTHNYHHLMEERKKHSGSYHGH